MNMLKRGAKALMEAFRLKAIKLGSAEHLHRSLQDVMASAQGKAPAVAKAKGIAKKEDPVVTLAAMKRAKAAAVPPVAMKRASAGEGSKKKRASAPSDGDPHPKKRVKLSAVLCDEIAELAGVTAKDTKAVMGAMRQVAARELQQKGSVKFASFIMFRLKKTAERPAKIKQMFGKAVHIAARPASEKVRSTILKPFKDLVSDGS